MVASDPPRAHPASAEAASAGVPASFASAVHLLRFATLMAVLLAVASFPRSTFFPIRAITVEGTQQISDDEVLARSQLRVGELFFAVPAADVAARIMRHPWVASAQVQLDNDGIVRIHLAERVPYAALAVNGAYYVVDRSGIVLERLQQPPELPILTLEGAGLARPQLGTPMPSTDALRAFEILQTLPSGSVGSRMQIKIAVNGDLTLITEDGIAILFGQPRGLHERLAVLEPLLTAVRSQSGAIAYVDLRYAGNVVIKPAGKGPRAGVRP